MAYLNDYKTPSNPTNFPPIPVAEGTLSNFFVAPTLPLMPDLSVTKKYLTFRWLAPDLTLNLTNAPWLSNVLKIEGFTSPTNGNNAQNSYVGAYNGLTPGGTLQRLVQNTNYKLVSGVFAGWVLPTSIEMLVPFISSLSSTTASPGDILNITGANLSTTEYVLVGGVSANISTGATTTTNLALTVPYVNAASNVPIVIITKSGNASISTLTVTGATANAFPYTLPFNLS